MVDFEAHLSHSYPSTPLEFTIRSDSLDRNGHAALTKEVSQFVMSRPQDSLVVSDTVELIRGVFAKYHRLKSEVRIPHAPKQPLTRLWIVSHHIYNKNKRRLILECGSQEELTGFCLPGKPGIICFEGPQQECLDAWSTIKGLTWQRIGLKHQESFASETGQCMESLRKFGKFMEISFNTKQNASRDHHMDMGEFVKFLKARNLEHVFEFLFGIEAKQ